MTSVAEAHIFGLVDPDPLTIGPYRVERRLGQGGMGVVYLAVGPDGQQVAVKVVRPDLADRSEFRARFTREVNAARAVGGQYTAPVIDADTESTPQWTATQYVVGPTLAEYVQSHGAMPEDQLRLLALGLAEAVSAIHAAGLIHRDLKPGNVILSTHGPKVIDFGISRSAEETGLTQSGTSLGSLAWMSPEQVGAGTITPASDMFSLGLVLAYAATGTHPFGEGRPEVLAGRIATQRATLPSRSPLSDLCRRLLDPDPRSRPTPADVVEALTDTPTPLTEVTCVVGSRWDATVASAYADPIRTPHRQGSAADASTGGQESGVPVEPADPAWFHVLGSGWSAVLVIGLSAVLGQLAGLTVAGRLNELTLVPDGRIWAAAVPILLIGGFWMRRRAATWSRFRRTIWIPVALAGGFSFLQSDPGAASALGPLAVILAMAVAVYAVVKRPAWLTSSARQAHAHGRRIARPLNAWSTRLRGKPRRTPEEIFGSLLSEVPDVAWNSPGGDVVAYSHLSVALHPATLAAVDRWMPVDWIAADLADSYSNAHRRHLRKSEHITVRIVADSTVPPGIASVDGAFRDQLRPDVRAQGSAPLTGPWHGQSGAGGQRVYSDPTGVVQP